MNPPLQEKVERLAAAVKRKFRNGVSFSDLAWPSPALNVLDCVLSLNRRYEGFCRPRVYDFAIRNPSVQSLRQLENLIGNYDSPYSFGKEHLDLRHADRMRILVDVLQYLQREQSKHTGGNELSRLRAWAVAAKPQESQHLRIRGFALSGFQYLRMLFGASTVKPDVHIVRFVRKATRSRANDWAALGLLEAASKYGGWHLRDLDFSIWRASAKHCRLSDDRECGERAETPVVAQHLRTVLGRSFRGYVTISDLRGSGLSQIPDKPGVYVIVRPISFVPGFLPISPAGWFKGRDPSVSIDELRKAWVDGASILYLGKGGGADMEASLRSRIGCYLKYGSGEAVAHEGGRYVWQLTRADDLVVAWSEENKSDPAEVESAMIQRFADTYGRRPFANLRLG